MKIFLTVAIVASTMLSACADSTNTNTTTNADTALAPANTPSPTYTAKAGVEASVAASIKSIVDGYLSIKNGLVNDKPDNAANAGKELLASTAAVKTEAMTAEQSKVWTSLAADMREHAEHISTNADKIEHQREHFEMLTEDVTELVKTFGGGQKLYVDHCPMAFDGKGANWLSEMEDIKNPYYGDEMLKCGEVKETLQ